MRKTLIITITTFMSLVLAYGFADAAITGIECVKCHTMHSSQTDPPSDWTEKGWTAGTLMGALVVGGCVGCHSNTTTSETIVDSGRRPIVWNTAAAANILAGGNFYWLTDETKVHNVMGVTDPDSKLGMTPPGWKKLTDIGPNEDTWSKQLRCAGAYGCHGNRATAVEDQFEAVRGYHHAAANTPYRFLYGIQGSEDNDWEQEAATDHNIYKGDDAASNSTISYLCGECHGKFHTFIGGANEVYSTTPKSPWLRHPTDIALAASNSSPFETDYGSTINYNVETPVGFENPGGMTSPITTFTASDARVLCLSCHRAHGTSVSDILRFTYNMQAGGNTTTGCLRCHKRQR